jgi:phosphoglycolate phosphatase-like HAD superfamily hydrolase
MPRQDKLIILDLDGTVWDVGGFNIEASKAVFDGHNREGDIRNANSHGSTMYLVNKALMRLVVDAPTYGHITGAMGRWINRGKELLDDDPNSLEPFRLYSGVTDLLSLLDKTAHLGIVSGNHRDLAQPILEYFSLEDIFTPESQIYQDGFIGNGRISSIAARASGIIICMMRQRQKGIKFNEVFYVGDAPTDIESANKADNVVSELSGIRVRGVAVAHTHTMNQLLAQNPAYCFENLKDHEHVANQILYGTQ